MGTVALGGSFSGLDWWSTDSPFASSAISNPTFSSDGDTLVHRTPDGRFRALVTTNPGGIINALCWSKDGSANNGTLYIGGVFESLSGISASNVASITLADSSVTALSGGLSGEVNTLFCDDDSSQVWVGGLFDAPIGSGGNVALWSTSSNTWVVPGFGGLNGRVQSITPSIDNSSIYFGGDFTTTFVQNSSVLSNSTSNTNGTFGNVTSTPSVSDNVTTVGDSGYLTPLTVSASASSSAAYSIQAGPSSSQPEYSDTNVLLCPGSGVWLAQDNTVSNVNLVGQSYLSATGIRVVNGLVEGRGTTYFCHCPLYINSSISAQDFIFTEGTQNFTGFEMQLKEWVGGGAAISSVALLSDGAYLSAVSDSGSSCSNGTKNGFIQTAGSWDTTNIATDSSTESYLSSSVSVGDSQRPQVTFYPHVSSAGNYDVYIFIPGCLNAGDCDSRTSVDVEVFPFSVGATTDSFTPTISLALSSDPYKPTRGHKYTVVADRVQLTFTGVNASVSSTPLLNNGTVPDGYMGPNGTIVSNSSLTTNSSYNVAFGVFEWSRTSGLNANAANNALSNVTETALTRLGFALDAALNASGSSAASWAVNTIISMGSTVFIGGDFSSTNNYTNVLSIDTSSGQTSALASQGLGGVVNTAVVIGEYVFFGGDFTSTASSGSVTLNYLARYDPATKAWAAVGGGVDGYVTDLKASPSSTELFVMGNFSHVRNNDGSLNETGGFGVWDINSERWTSTGVVFGNISAGEVISSSPSNVYLTGRVSGYADNTANGLAMLSTGQDGLAQISSLAGASFSNRGSASSLTASRRRSLDVKSSYSPSWLSRFTGGLVERALPGLTIRATAPLIATPSFPAPAVLAVDYWTNTSASDSPSMMILGGNFTSPSVKVRGMAFYSASQETIDGPEPPVSGVVRAMEVIGDRLYLGGEGINVEGIGSGLLVYNLLNGTWMEGGMASLNAASDSNVTINQIRTRPTTDTVVVAGSFSSAGSLSCAAICLWDSINAQWSTLGAGLLSGEVRSIDFAGNTYGTLIAAGSFVLSDGTVAYVASYDFGSSSWTALGSLSGPALAVAVDDKNTTNIFAAGYSASDGSPYLEQWNGNAWTVQNETLQSGSLVQQLAFVPMSSEHTAMGSIEKDRMLIVSGNLYLDQMGNATSALYDGVNWYPYLVGTSTAGGIGAGSSLFWSDSEFSFKVQHYLARGLVVLVAIAIATGIVLLFILLVLLIAYFNRRRDSQPAQDRQEIYGKEGSDVSSTHQNVFANVQAALEASLAGGAGTIMGVGASRNSAPVQARLSDPSLYASGAYPMASDDEYDEEEEEGDGRETTMRYDFEGPELHEGEMSMKAGQLLIILDDQQSHEWWYARDPATGREGMVPASYGE
uniref:SH3 domain-containing protein n=1 Tax=Cryptococcus bacillisporus CA1280 TaxID=1296109 RepID=A0A0D0VRU2_CRYGA|nr:hypothetical protein I312_00898 [Cryptococcus bacillisporus CA1280]